MPIEEEEAIAELAGAIANSREIARRLSLPFASRLLDMCLLEVAMVWAGRDQADPCDEQTLTSLLDIKLRMARAEQAAGGLAVSAR